MATRSIVKSPKIEAHFPKLALLSKDLDVAGVQKFIAEEYALGSARPGCWVEGAIADQFETIMPTVTTLEKPTAESPLPVPMARIGMIIPSVNSMTEPQFNHFAPPGLAVHVARARVAGEWKRPLAAMADEIATSAKLLGRRPRSHRVPLHGHLDDAGPQGEGRILDIVREATGIEAVATSRLVLEALQALGLRRLVLLSPARATAVIDYLQATGLP